MKDDIFLKETEALHNLRVLEEIDKNPSISQRELSGRLNVALGITNALIKTLVRKGFIKIRGENNRSLTYHLTHAGVLAKSSLAMRWTLNTIDFYRQARKNMANKIATLTEEGAKTIVLYGANEVTEIVSIVTQEAGMEIAGVIRLDKENENGEFQGHPVISQKELAEMDVDAVIICSEVTEDDLAELRRNTEASTELFSAL